MAKIMLSAGEASGDTHGASLAKAILAQAPETELIGFGGRNMRAAGVTLAADMADYSVMGVVEVVLNLRKIFRLLDLLTDLMKQEKPDLLVLIDYPDFNWRLARRARELGVPVLSYIPPSAWAWRKGRAKELAPLAEEFIAIFPFETQVYKDAGANISFVGNPLVDTVKPDLTAEETREFFGITEEMYPVLLLPGSRRQEIKLLLPTMLAAAKKIKEARPEAEFFLPVAQSIREETLQEYASQAGVKVHFTHEHTYALMTQMQFALATSGTVVLEAALLGLPCIVLYRMAKLNYFIGRLLVHIDYFSLPNILLNEAAQPELLQDEVNPVRILQEAQRFWQEAGHRGQVQERLRAACALLGEPNAASRVAERILAAAARGKK